MDVCARKMNLPKNLSYLFSFRWPCCMRSASNEIAPQKGRAERTERVDARQYVASGLKLLVAPFARQLFSRHLTARKNRGCMKRSRGKFFKSIPTQQIFLC